MIYFKMGPHTFKETVDALTSRSDKILVSYVHVKSASADGVWPVLAGLKIYIYMMKGSIEELVNLFFNV